MKHFIDRLFDLFDEEDPLKLFLVLLFIPAIVIPPISMITSCSENSYKHEQRMELEQLNIEREKAGLPRLEELHK